MPGFVYSNERPAQLCYTDAASGQPELLPFWVHNESDLARAITAIRARAFGSIPYSAFSLKIFTWYNSYSADTDVINDVPFYLSVAIPYPNFGSGTNTIGRAV